MHLRACVLAAVVAWVGCTSTAPQSPFPTAAHEDGGASSSPTISGDGGTGSRCQRKLDIGALTMSKSTCFVNEHVSHQSTVLQFPCEGGAAKATFGTHVFTGTVTGNVVDLVDVEPFVFNDCDWISTETIKGDLATSTLTYAYSEKPKTTCVDEPCTADGTLDVNAGAVEVVK